MVNDGDGDGDGDGGEHGRVGDPAAPKGAGSQVGDVPTRTDTAIKIALSLVPYAGGPLGVLYEDVVARRRAKLDEFGQASFDRYPGGWEGLLNRLEHDPRLAELYVRAGEHAMTSTLREKAAALGRMLADAAQTNKDDDFDRLELLSLALLDLEGPHLRALQRLAGFPSDEDLYDEHARASGFGREGPEGVNLSNLVTADERRKARQRTLADMPTPVMAALVRHGLVIQESGYGLYVSGVSRFGMVLLAYVYEASTSSDQP